MTTGESSVVVVSTNLEKIGEIREILPRAVSIRFHIEEIQDTDTLVVNTFKLRDVSSLPHDLVVVDDAGLSMKMSGDRWSPSALIKWAPAYQWYSGLAVESLCIGLRSTRLGYAVVCRHDTTGRVVCELYTPDVHGWDSCFMSEGITNAARKRIFGPTRHVVLHEAMGFLRHPLSHAVLFVPSGYPVPCRVNMLLQEVKDLLIRFQLGFCSKCQLIANEDQVLIRPGQTHDLLTYSGPLLSAVVSLLDPRDWPVISNMLDNETRRQYLQSLCR